MVLEEFKMGVRETREMFRKPEFQVWVLSFALMISLGMLFVVDNYYARQAKFSEKAINSCPCITSPSTVMVAQCGEFYDAVGLDSTKIVLPLDAEAWGG